MSPLQLLHYLGPALGFALLATGVIMLLARPARLGLDLRHALTIALVLFFLALTQHPFPDPASLDCSQGGAPPILRPFATLDHVRRLWIWQQNDPAVGLRHWIGSKVIQAAAMNFLLCAAIGSSLARHAGDTHPWWRAAAFAVTLSGGVEIAQLTGLFGLYPCAWRQFEVDDLILNISGLLAGFGLMRARLRRG